MTNKNFTWQNPLPNVPWVESPFFEMIFTDKYFDQETLRIAKDLNENGYAILDFPDANFDEIVDCIQRELVDKYDWSGVDKGNNPRIQDAWKFSESVKKIAVNSKITKLLENLYGRKPIPFQTLNFPVGTEQSIHSDAVHFNSIPERYMCGVWVAFEDIDDSNGPLFYVPKSHKLPIYINEHLNKVPDPNNPYINYHDYDLLWNSLCSTYNLKKEYFYPRKGQALIWASNLLHGGSFQTDKTRTRHSQVTHYFFENCVYYTPLSSLQSLGTTYHRTIVNIANEEIVPNRINHINLDEEYLDFVSLFGERSRKILEDASKKKNLNQEESPTELPADFNGEVYLKLHPDVAEAGMDPQLHYLQYGRHENRQYK